MAVCGRFIFADDAMQECRIPAVDTDCFLPECTDFCNRDLQALKLTKETLCSQGAVDDQVRPGASLKLAQTKLGVADYLAQNLHIGSRQ